MEHVDHIIIRHPSRPELNDKYLQVAMDPDAAIETLVIDGVDFYATDKIVALAQADGMVAQFWEAKISQPNPFPHA